MRRAKAADVPGIVKLERETATAAHWSRQQYEDLFLRSDNPRPEYFVWLAEDDSSVQPESDSPPCVLAFAVVHRIDAEWELQNIVVAEAIRRHGFATALLREFIAFARSERAGSVFLEVRQSNTSARALYRKLGFMEAGLRKTYYSDPQEDAVVYWLSFG